MLYKHDFHALVCTVLPKPSARRLGFLSALFQPADDLSDPPHRHCMVDVTHREASDYTRGFLGCFVSVLQDSHAFLFIFEGHPSRKCRQGLLLASTGSG